MLRQSGRGVSLVSNHRTKKTKTKTKKNKKKKKKKNNILFHFDKICIQMQKLLIFFQQKY